MENNYLIFTIINTIAIIFIPIIAVIVGQFYKKSKIKEMIKSRFLRF